MWRIWTEEGIRERWWAFLLKRCPFSQSLMTNHAGLAVFFCFFLNRRLKPNTCWVLVLMTGFKRIITHLFLGFLPHLVLLTLQGESFSQHGKLNGQRRKKYLRNDWDKEGKCYTRVKFIRISCFVPFYIYIMPCPHSRTLYKSIQMPAFEKL